MKAVFLRLALTLAASPALAEQGQVALFDVPRDHLNCFATIATVFPLVSNAAPWQAKAATAVAIAEALYHRRKRTIAVEVQRTDVADKTISDAFLGARVDINAAGSMTIHVAKSERQGWFLNLVGRHQQLYLDARASGLSPERAAREAKRRLNTDLPASRGIDVPVDLPEGYVSTIARNELDVVVSDHERDAVADIVSRCP